MERAPFGRIMRAAAALCLSASMAPRAAAQLAFGTAATPSNAALVASQSVSMLSTGQEVLAQLLQTVGGFQLTAGLDASMRDINGGRMCVDDTGLEPPGYELRGQLDLTTCAELAKQQPKVVGFRWGRKSFSTEAYTRYATLGAGGLPRGTPVQLQDLFGGRSNFSCVIYMVEDNGEAARFEETELTRRFGYRSVVKATSDAIGNKGAGDKASEIGSYRKPRDVEGQAGRDVCSQRWTLLEFFNPHVTELWFCYTPVTRWNSCEDRLRNFRYVQGFAFIGCIIAISAVLAMIMKKQSQFTWALLWAARFLLNMELGLGSVAVLLTLGFDGSVDEAKFFVVALMLIIGSCNLVLLPFICWEPGSCSAVFYLLVLLFSAPVVAEVMSYYPAFPLLVSHRPMLLGALGFLIELGKCVLLGDVASPTKGDATLLQGQPTNAGPNSYVRMYPSGV